MPPLTSPVDEVEPAESHYGPSDMKRLTLMYFQTAHQVLATRSSFWWVLSCRPFHNGLSVAAEACFFSVVAQSLLSVLIEDILLDQGGHFALRHVISVTSAFLQLTTTSISLNSAWSFLVCRRTCAGMTAVSSTC